MDSFMLDLVTANDLLKPLLFFVIGIVLYSVFTFNFYRFVAREDIFKLNLSQYNRAKHAGLERFISVIFYIIKYIVVFPVFVGFWVGVLTVLLAFMSSGQTLAQVFFVAIALVTAVRISAYYNEDLSRDLAKMLPFALLGVFLVDISYFSASESIDLLNTWRTLLPIAPYYWLFAVAVEFLLRIYHGIAGTPASESAH